MKSPVGIVRIRLEERGRLAWLYEGRNLFVNAGLAAPTVTDSALTAPGYYKTLDSHSEDGNGSVTFNWSLTSADTGALGITIQELALFANHASAGLPGTTQPTPMLARKTIAPIVFGAGMSISGTWTLTF